MRRFVPSWMPSLASSGAPGARSEPPAPLDGRRLLAARALWLGVVIFCEGLLGASVPQRYAALLHPTAPGVRASLAHLGLSTAFYAAYHLALESIPAAGFLAMALVIFVRQSDEWPAIFASLVLAAFGAALPGTMYTFVSGLPIWAAPFPLLEALGWFLLLVFAYLFPNGRFVPRWEGWLVPAWGAWVATFFALAPVLAARRAWLVALTFIIWVGWFGTGVLSQVYRYLWTATFAQRQQTKWVVLGFVVALCGVALAVAPSIAVLSNGQTGQIGQQGLLYELVATAVASLSALCIPLSLGIAILRHRLFDIDVLINRALVYGSLTLALALLYVLCVVALQTVFGALTGQGSVLALVTSTLAIAALFNPLRQRIQRGIDRRFYRGRYDAARTLEAFAATLHHEVDLERLSAELVRVVDGAMRPAHVSLWLRPYPDRAAGDLSGATSGDDSGPTHGGREDGPDA